MEAPNIPILETTVKVLRERRLNVHANEVEKCITYIEAVESGIPIQDNQAKEEIPDPVDLEAEEPDREEE
jgi:hypothetical protein